MQIYIDESGNLGKKGRYFVIAMLIPFKKKRIKNIIKNFCSKESLEEIKGTLLTFLSRQNIINKLNKFPDYSVSYIVADLKYIDNAVLKDKNICYNYLYMHLLKRTIKNANEDIEILTDNHEVKVGSINSLNDYIRTKAIFEWGFKYNVRIEYRDSKKVKNIQMVDIIANTIYRRYTENKKDLYEILRISESIKFPLDKFGM
ncbi:MAG: DUF3800 domain-containing protein [Patescibacteria group bacterium]|jgi:hypothetical protein